MDENHCAHIIDRLAALAGTKAELARRMGVRPQDIQNWSARGIPLSKCPLVSREFDVPMEELRPDTFEGLSVPKLRAGAAGDPAQTNDAA